MNKNILIFTRPASLPKYQILDADNKKVSILARNIDCFDTSDPAIFLFGQLNKKKIGTLCVHVSAKQSAKEVKAI